MNHCTDDHNSIQLAGEAVTKYNISAVATVAVAKFNVAASLEFLDAECLIVSVAAGEDMLIISVGATVGVGNILDCFSAIDGVVDPVTADAAYMSDGDVLLSARLTQKDALILR